MPKKFANSCAYLCKSCVCVYINRKDTEIKVYVCINATMNIIRSFFPGLAGRKESSSEDSDSSLSSAESENSENSSLVEALSDREFSRGDVIEAKIPGVTFEYQPAEILKYAYGKNGDGKFTLKFMNNGYVVHEIKRDYLRSVREETLVASGSKFKRGDRIEAREYKKRKMKVKKQLNAKQAILKKHSSSPLMKNKKLSSQSRTNPILTPTRKEPSIPLASKKNINKISPKIVVTDTTGKGKKLLQKQFHVNDGVKTQSVLVATPGVKRKQKKYQKYEKHNDEFKKPSTDLSRKSIYGDLQVKTHFDEDGGIPGEPMGQKHQQDRAETPETPDNYKWNKPILSKSQKLKRVRTPNAVPLPNILTSSSPLLTLRLVKGKLFNNVGKSRPDTAEEDRITPRYNNGNNEADVPVEVINVDSLEYTIGRDITNSCTLDSKRNPKMLSKLHAQIQIEISNMGKPIIQLLDMNSTNGTYITGNYYDHANLNWTRIKQKPIDLFDGNIIKFGRKRSSDLVYQVDISPTILNDIARLATHNRIGSPLGKVRFLQGGGGVEKTIKAKDVEG